MHPVWGVHINFEAGLQSAGRRLIPEAVPKIAKGTARQIAIKLACRYPHHHLRLYEPVHLRRLFALLNIDCVFDVGANAGQYADMLRNRVGYPGLIVSFEPIPDHAAALRERAANDPLWDVRETALSSRAGQAVFSVMASDQFSSLADPDHGETGRFADQNQPVRKIQVTTETLDGAYRELSEKYGFRQPFLKMDTQGFDLEVLRGGASVLTDFLGVQSELSIVTLYKDAPKMQEMISELDRLGYGLSALVPNNEGHFPTLMEIDGIFVRKDHLDLRSIDATG